jgi:hypothetical protein
MEKKIIHQSNNSDVVVFPVLWKGELECIFSSEESAKKYCDRYNGGKTVGYRYYYYRYLLLEDIVDEPVV